MRQVCIIGSTGSIGKNALEVISQHPDEFSVYALAVNTSIDLLFEQVVKFKPKLVVVHDEDKKDLFCQKLTKEYSEPIEVYSGAAGLIAAVTHPEVDQVLLALMGAQGLVPLVKAIEAKKHIALANKEPLVMAGELIHDLVREHGVHLIPVDSEHSGVFQCIQDRSRNEISSIYLTASGGPFLNRDEETFSEITPEEAVKHPKWSMGQKISVDSATLMNKGLEVIEANSLFQFNFDQIHVLIHPEAVVHALSEFVDGSQLAQIAATDMKLPIQFALSYPKRIPMKGLSLNLSDVKQLNFMKPDMGKFPCLRLAYEAGEKGGTFPCVLNAANEVCVDQFLKNKILFTQIPVVIEAVLKQHEGVKKPNLEEVLTADGWARKIAAQLIYEMKSNNICSKTA